LFCSLYAQGDAGMARRTPHPGDSPVSVRSCRLLRLDCVE
jgi:hypothetical protein